MREHDIIAFVQDLVGDGVPDKVDLGIGDDCAVLRTDANRLLVTSTDMLVEGIHYHTGTDPGLIGRKAVSRAVSDLAAMAADPVGCIAAVSLPDAIDERSVRELFVALEATARALGAPLIGGDVGSGTEAMVMAVTVFGVPGPGGYITRSGAQTGDAICVTGRLGGALTANRHLTFRPRIREALYISEHYDIHAMIDISDGLSTDLYHLCGSSGKGAIIQAESIPLHPDLTENNNHTLNKPELLQHALNDGEDYELLFCVSRADARRLPSTIPSGKRATREAPQSQTVSDDVNITCIGSCIDETNIYLEWSTDGHKREVLEDDGWEHRINEQQ